MCLIEPDKTSLALNDVGTLKISVHWAVHQCFHVVQDKNISSPRPRAHYVNGEAVHFSVILILTGTSLHPASLQVYFQ